MASPRHLAAALVSALALSCSHPPGGARRDLARRRAAARGPALPARTYRVRVPASPTCRARGPSWEDRLRRQLALASEITAPTFGVTFQLVDVRPVEARPVQAPGAPQSLDALLEALEQVDPGDDVDLVLGCAGPPPEATAVQDQLGRSRVLGHHMVLRGLESGEEEAAAFLHAWGHTLGAHHTPDGLMFDSYSRDDADFSPESVAVISIGLRQKPPGLRDPEVRAAWAKELSAWLDSEAGKTLDPGARKYLAALVAAAGADPEAVMSLADREVMQRAIQQDHAARYAEASETLRPLLERHPKHPRLHAVACQVQIHAGASGDAAWMLCARAAELDPQSPSVSLFVADMAEQRKDSAAAHAALARARQSLEGMKDAPADHWSYLAALHRQWLEVSAAESALVHAGEGPDTQELRDWAQRTRRWVGLVPGAIAPEREAGYVREFQQVLQELDQRQHGRAARRIAAMEKDFAGAAGPLSLRCELQLRQGAGPGGLKDCRRALERYGDSSHARYVLGIGLFRARDWAGAIAALEKVVELDPTLPDAWARLSEAYRASGNARAADALRERYREKLGAPPPFR